MPFDIGQRVAYWSNENKLPSAACNERRHEESPPVTGIESDPEH